MEPVSRRRALLGTGLVAATFPRLALPQARKTARPLRAPWDSFWFAGYIAKTGLETLGYKVEEPKVMTPAPLATAVAQGDADFSLDIVMPGSSALFAGAAIKDRTYLLGPTMKPGSVTGYLVDKASADRLGIRYITDFRDPKIAAHFSEGADKRARLIGPGAGFNDEKKAVEDMARLGLKDTVSLVVGEYNVIVADVVARYRAGKPVFLYAWFPNVATVELMPGKDLVFLEEQGARAEFSVDGVPGCASGQTTCNTGWSPTTYFTVANKQWADENPAAAKFLGAMRFKVQDRVDQNILMAKGEKRERDLVRHAEDWIKANRAAFDSWLAAARS